jgi:Inner membrane protein YgaP-like, transmembrane domain
MLTKHSAFAIKNSIKKGLIMVLRGGTTMTMEPLILAIAGTFVLASLALGYFGSPYWHLFTAFAGLNLLQSAFTKWSLMEHLLSKMGIRKTS